MINKGEWRIFFPPKTQSKSECKIKFQVEEYNFERLSLTVYDSI